MNMKILTNVITNVITNAINFIKSIKYTNNIDIDPSNDLVMNTDNVASFKNRNTY